MKTAFLLSSALFLASCANAPVAEAEPASAPQAAIHAPFSDSTSTADLTQSQRFEIWKVDFINRAIEKN